MANTIGETQVADFIPEIWGKESIGYLRRYSQMAPLVKKDFSNDEFANAGDTIHLPERGSLSTNDKTSGNPVTLQNPSTSKVDVTLSNHKEVSIAVEDVAEAQTNQDTMAGYIEDAIAQLAEDIDTDLLALYSSLTGTAKGTYGTDISPDMIVDARKILADNNIPKGKRKYLVMSTKDEANLLKQTKFTSAEWLNDQGEAIREAALGRRYGIDMFVDQGVPTSGSSPTQTHNLMFAKDAMVLATRPIKPAPAGLGARSSVVTDEDTGIAVRVTYSWNADQLATQVTIDVLYGVSVYRADLGLEVKS